MSDSRRQCRTVLVLAGLIVCAQANGGEVQSLPNVVIIYADDLGYGDVSCYNRERGKIPTPNIDRLASQGMRFTDGHSSSGVCSPSRYTLLTGRYHWRTRLQKGIVGLWDEPLIAADRVTIATLLAQQGYQTACFGKWHLGWEWPIAEGAEKLFRGEKTSHEAASNEHLAAWKETFSQPIPGGPMSRGFDEYFGTDVPNWPPYGFIDGDTLCGIPTEFLPSRLLEKNQASVQGPAVADWTLEPILPALGQRTSKYIIRASQSDQPFLIYMPLTAPHTPLSVNDEWKGKSGLNLYADFVMETDSVVGQILDALEDNGLTDNTLVVFTSDNGCAPYIGISDLEAMGHFPSGPLRGAKSDVWEGGHRVPFIVRWPGHIEPGSVCHQLVHQADLIATCADIVGVQLLPSAGEDSVSLMPLFARSDEPVRNHAVSQSIKGLIGIRRGSWKLIFGSGSGGWGEGEDSHPMQLYDLASDLGETKNLFEKRPDIVEELSSLMSGFVENGRSTPGEPQRNDHHFDWMQFVSAGK